MKVFGDGVGLGVQNSPKNKHKILARNSHSENASTGRTRWRKTNEKRKARVKDIIVLGVLVVNEEYRLSRDFLAVSQLPLYH